MDKLNIKEIVLKYKNSRSGNIDAYFPLFMNDRLQSIFRKQEEPKEKDYQEVADLLNTLIGTDLQAGHIQAILDFYPYIKTKISHYPAYDPVMRDMLLDTISDFMLGCNWLEYEDGIEEKDYIDVIVMQIEAFIKGFEKMMELKLITPSSLNVNEIENQFSSHQTQDKDIIVFSKNTLSELSDLFEHWLDIKLTDKEINNIISVSDSLQARLFQWGVHDTDIGVEINEAFFEYYFGDAYEEKSIEECREAVLERRKE